MRKKDTYDNKVLIGGKALNILGSRMTLDTDYLIRDEREGMFIADEANNVDYINAAGHVEPGPYREIEKIFENLRR